MGRRYQVEPGATSAFLVLHLNGLTSSNKRSHGNETAGLFGRRLHLSFVDGRRGKAVVLVLFWDGTCNSQRQFQWVAANVEATTIATTGEVLVIALGRGLTDWSVASIEGSHGSSHGSSNVSRASGYEKRYIEQNSPSSDHHDQDHKLQMITPVIGTSCLRQGRVNYKGC